MKFLAKLLLPVFKKYVIQELVKESNKTFVVNKLNELVDIPNMSEEDEAKVISNIYDALEKLLESYLKVKED